MKTLKMKESEMNFLKGGDKNNCLCGCYAAQKGGSSRMDNGTANQRGGGLESPGARKDVDALVLAWRWAHADQTV